MEQGPNGQGPERAAAGRPPPPPKPELQRALTDLETAVQRLASSAKDHFSGRAISAVEEAVERLNRIEHKRFRRSRRDRYRDDADGIDDDDYDAAPSARQATTGDGAAPRDRHVDDDRDYGYRRSRRRRQARRAQLFRVPAEGMITGVCAGLARRWGVENWVVRCLAVTGLVFMPQFAFIAYWVMFFRMGSSPPPEAQMSSGFGPPGLPGRAPIPGFDRGLVSAKERMRSVRAQFDNLEGRLRKLEGYVTSSRFELDRAMHEIGG